MQEAQHAKLINEGNKSIDAGFVGLKKRSPTYKYAQSASKANRRLGRRRKPNTSSP